MKWGSEGEANGQLSAVESIVVDSNNNIYVADFGNDRIQKFTKDGQFITKWGTSGSEVGQFMGPAGLAVDSEDNIYVTDRDNDRVQIFTSNGNVHHNYWFAGQWKRAIQSSRRSWR